MVLIFGIGVETSMFMRMSTFVLALCLSLCCIILSHCIDARVVNDFVLDFLLHVQIQLTDVYMHVSIHKTQHTKNDVCIYVWRIYLWQNRNRQRTLLSVFLFPDPCEFLPTLPRYHQGAIDLRWLLRWTGCQRNSNIWQTDFVAIKGMKAELQLDEGTNMINMMRLYSLWGKILDSLNWWRPTSSKNHSISGVSKDPVLVVNRSRLEV